MNQYGEYAGITGDIDRPQHGIAQQSLPDSLIVVVFVDSKPTEQQNRQGIRHIAPQRLGRRDMADRTGREAVVANDSRAGTQHETT